jgi:hypothetical protein
MTTELRTMEGLPDESAYTIFYPTPEKPYVEIIGNKEGLETLIKMLQGANAENHGFASHVSTDGSLSVMVRRKDDWRQQESPQT